MLIKNQIGGIFGGIDELFALRNEEVQRYANTLPSRQGTGLRMSFSHFFSTRNIYPG
jgi:hypothetical protein